MAIFDHPGAPAAHALVIGVNSYPHLGGGDPGDSLVLQGLEQLTSPVPSAVSFAHWFQRDFRHPVAARGSLRVLLSGGSYVAPDGTVHQVSSPTKANIKAEFDQWKRRCDESQSNLALFYFCGHGFNNGIVCLLPEDTGVDPNDPWANCLDFTTSFKGMERCLAGTQCYFIDACQEDSPEARIAGISIGWKLISALGGAATSRVAPIYAAAGDGQVAYGNSNDPSVFTSALLKALTRFGASAMVPRDPDWAVTTGAVGEAMAELLSRGNRPSTFSIGGLPTRAERISSIVHAEALASVIIEPPEALAEATLGLGSSTHSASRAPEARPWKLELPPDTYQVTATYQQYQDQQAQIQIFPPVMQPLRLLAQH